MPAVAAGAAARTTEVDVVARDDEELLVLVLAGRDVDVAAVVDGGRVEEVVDVAGRGLDDDGDDDGDEGLAVPVDEAGVEVLTRVVVGLVTAKGVGGSAYPTHQAREPGGGSPTRHNRIASRDLGGHGRGQEREAHEDGEGLHGVWWAVGGRRMQTSGLTDRTPKRCGCVRTEYGGRDAGSTGEGHVPQEPEEEVFPDISAVQARQSSLRRHQTATQPPASSLQPPALPLAPSCITSPQR